MTSAPRFRRFATFSLLAIGLALTAVLLVPAPASASTVAGLAATGQAIPLWIPIVGGILLLAGIAAVVVTGLRRRGGGDEGPNE